MDTLDGLRVMPTADGCTYGEVGDSIPEGVRVTATFSGPGRPNRVVEVDALPYVCQPEDGEQFVQFATEFATLQFAGTVLSGRIHGRAIP